MRNIASLFILLVVFLTGCLESEKSATVGTETQRIDPRIRVMEHLRRQNPPALQSVETWENEYGPGLKLTTAHYEILTTLLEPLILSEVPGFMESAYRGYQGQLPRPIATASKFTIYLFADREQWEAFTRDFTGPQATLYCKIRAGAYYLNGACVAYNIGRDRTFSVLGHEGWHQFNSRHFRFRLPSWLDEGVAMLFETSRYDRGLFTFDAARNLPRLGTLKTTLTKNQMIPLRDLVGTNPGDVLATDQAEAIMAFYGQSYALVRFLREEGYGKRLADFHRLLMDGLTGNWPLSDTAKRIAANRNIPLTARWNRAVGKHLFEQYIDDDFETIEEEYIAFCRKIVYHVHFK